MASGISAGNDYSTFSMSSEGINRDPLCVYGPPSSDNSTTQPLHTTRPMAASQQFGTATLQTGCGVAAPGGEMQPFWATPGPYAPMFVPIALPPTSGSGIVAPLWTVPANVSGAGGIASWSLAPPLPTLPYPPVPESRRPDIFPQASLQYDERDWSRREAVIDVSRRVNHPSSSQDATGQSVALPMLAQAAATFEPKLLGVSPSHAGRGCDGDDETTAKKRRIHVSRVPTPHAPVPVAETSDIVPNLPDARVVRSSDSSRLYVCGVPRCKALHASISALTHHLAEAHHITKPYQCGVSNCHHMLASRAALAMHMKGHAAAKVYRCDYPGCDAEFTQSSNLTRHTRVHTGERPFKCTYDGCHSAFAQKSTLVFHLRTHTNERPFPCAYTGCKAAFRLRSALTVHERVHTGERPYACQHPGCGKRFQTNSHLTRHGIVHSK